MPDASAPQRHAVAAAAPRLAHAASSREPCTPVRDLLGSSDISLAYQVQRRLGEDRIKAGARVVGRKIGLTSKAVQQQIGVDSPDFGVLFDDMRFPDGATIPYDWLLQPRAEAEIAFVLAEDLADGPLDEAHLRVATAYAVGALEIVDSRVLDWDIAITDTVADNASSGVFVLGDRKLRITDFEPAEVAMTMHRNGVLASSGNGRACLGDPLTALSWLARTARDFGFPLRGGDIVLSGSLGPLVDLRPGDQVTAELSELGRVTASFTSLEQ